MKGSGVAGEWNAAAFRAYRGIELGKPEKQILRLPPPSSAPKSKPRSLGTPLKKTLGAPCAQDDGLSVCRSDSKLFAAGFADPVRGPLWFPDKVHINFADVRNRGEAIVYLLEDQA